MHCIATRGNADSFESVDHYDNVNFVLKFGFGVYLANSIILIFALVSGFNKIAALVQTLISCFSGIPVIVQVVYLGIYRFNWVGSACSD